MLSPLLMIVLFIHFINFYNNVLTYHLFQVFNEESTTFQQFKNLRNLLLQNCDVSDDFQTLALFLENSPNLEKLTLRHCTVYCSLIFQLLMLLNLFCLTDIFYATNRSQMVQRNHHCHPNFVT